MCARPNRPQFTQIDYLYVHYSVHAAYCTRCSQLGLRGCVLGSRVAVGCVSRVRHLQTDSSPFTSLKRLLRKPNGRPAPPRRAAFDVADRAAAAAAAAAAICGLSCGDPWAAPGRPAEVAQWSFSAISGSDSGR